MTTPPPATPFRVPLGQPPGARPPAGGAPARTSSASRFLSTPRGQLAAAAGAIVAIALYRRYKNKKGTDAAAAASSATANPQGTADTTATDLYGAYEQLAENLSGYNNAGQLAQIQALLQQSLAKSSGTTSTSTGSTSSGSTTTSTGVPPGWVTEFHRVGVVGQGVNIADYIKHLRPNIAAKDLTAAEYATIINPANKSLGLGRSPIIPGGDAVTFVLPATALPPTPGALHDIATRGTIRNAL